MKKVDLQVRYTKAVDVLKTAITNDRYAMVSAEQRHGREAKERTDAAIKNGLVELALDILTGED